MPVNYRQGPGTYLMCSHGSRFRPTQEELDAAGGIVAYLVSKCVMCRQIWDEENP